VESNKMKLFVGELLNEGLSLSDIQKKLQSEKNIKMTFLDLRLLASELEAVDWTKQKADIEAAKAEEKAKEDKKKEAENKADNAGKTVVEVSRLKRPGALANGTVEFASGAKAEWILDQSGRLGLDKQTGEPTQEDVQEFQEELQNILAKSGM
jgi:hypothetical protein